MPTISSHEQQIQQFNAVLLNHLYDQLPNVSEAEIAYDILKRNSKQNQNHEFLLHTTLKKINKCSNTNALGVLKDYFNQQASRRNNDPIRTQRYIDWAQACEDQTKALLISMEQENIPLPPSNATIDRIDGIAFLTDEKRDAYAKPHNEKAAFTLNSAAARPNLKMLTATISSILEIMDEAELLATTAEDFASLNQQLQQHLAALPQRLTYNKKYLNSKDATNEAIQDSTEEEAHIDSLELCIMAYRDNILSPQNASIYTQALTQAKQEALSQHGFWKAGAPSDQQQTAQHTRPEDDITQKRKYDGDDNSSRKSPRSPLSPEELWQGETEDAAGLLLALSTSSYAAKP